MKKALSLILCILMVFGSFAGTLTVSAEADLWTSVSEGDFLDAPQNPYANFGSYADDVVTVISTISYQQFGLKMPELKANTDYKLSFGYKMETLTDEIATVRILTMAEYEKFRDSKKDLNLTEFGQSRQILGRTKSSTPGEFVNTGEYLFNTGDATNFVLFFQMNGYATRFFYLNNLTLVETYGVFVDGGNATVNDSNISKASAGETVTITATPDETQIFSHWEVTSGNITFANKTSSTTTFIMPENAVSVKAVYKENLWFTLNDNDIVNFSGAAYPSILNEFKNGEVVIKTIHYQNFYIKMPELEANTTYKLSMAYSITNNMSQSGMRILNQSQLDTMIENENYNLPSAANSVANLFDAGNSGSNNACYFTTDSTTNYYVVIRCANVGDAATTMTLSNIALTKIETYDIAISGGIADKSFAREGETVTITATPESGKIFSHWEVVSENVIVSDSVSETATFTMPAEEVRVRAVYTDNLWGDINVNSETPWFGTKDESPNTDSNTGRVLFGFSKYSDTTFNDAIVVNGSWYTTFYIKLPSNLKPNTDYKFTFNYNNLKKDLTGGIARIDIVTEEDLDSIDESGKLKTTFKNLAGKTALDKGEWSEFSADFKTGDSETQYYLYFTTDYCHTLYLGGFEFELVETVETAYNNVAALRSATSSSTGKNGLRIYNKIGKEWVENKKIVEFGSIAIIKSKLNEDNLTLDIQGINKGVAYSNGDNSPYQAPKLWNTTDESYIFTSYLTNLPPKYYGEDISVRAYAIDSSGKVYYGKTVNVSIFNMLYSMEIKYSEAPDSVPEADQNVFKTFVEEAGADAYKNWCIDKYDYTLDLYNHLFPEQS